ncbi:hypothetical protein D7Y15_43995, partial [Corallococcus sp. AB030]
ADPPRSGARVGAGHRVRGVVRVPGHQGRPHGVRVHPGGGALHFGFFFVTVSARITGEIGSSSNPISGMVVATLLVTCLVYLLFG